jgi:hypothetical protein
MATFLGSSKPAGGDPDGEGGGGGGSTGGATLLGLLALGLCRGWRRRARLDP